MRNDPTAPAASRIPILLMVQSLGPGGTERQVTELASALQNSAFVPHVAAVYDQGIRADDLRARGVPIVRIPLRGLLTRSALDAFVQLRAYRRQHGIRLLHAFDPPSDIFGVPVGRALCLEAVLSSQRCYRELIMPKHRPLLRLSDRLAHGIVVNCAAIQRHLIEDEGVPARKVHVCYNAVDFDLFHAQDRAPSDSGLVVGTVSVLRPEKDLLTLVRAFAMLHSSHPESRLVFVGGGPERERLQTTAAELGIADACTFQDSTPDVASWLRGMDIFVLPSISEALSNSLMEAMACGCAPVASRVGGNVELIRDGETGFLFKPGDAHELAAQLRTLADSPELRHAMAANATRMIHANFSQAKMSERMQEIYRAHLKPVY